MTNRKNSKISRIEKLKRLFAFALIICAFAMPNPTTKAEQGCGEIEITPNFTGREIAPNERIELKLNRALTANEGRFAVLVGATDVSALFSIEGQNLSYAPRLVPLPAGENNLTIYLVTPDEDWKLLAEFPLKVKAAASETANNGERNAATKAADRWKVEFTPNVALNLKGQNQTLTFPRESEPARNPFADVDGQGNFFLKVSRRGWSFANKFDLVGVSFQQNALRFGELQNRALKVDLSSYLIEFGKQGLFKANLGHVSFGSNRHLINSFSSRGISVTVPIGKQNEISFAVMNGTSIVGFDNFLGATRRKHSVVSTIFAREFFKERPAGLRLEFSVMRGSLLPLSNFNQREVNDAEKSLGFGLRIIGSDPKQRLRYEAGFTRSRFTNPRDPLLEQGLSVTPIRPATRNARYADISFDFVQGLKLWREKKLKLTGTFRHEEIQPLFRSLAASTQADRRQNQFEVVASFGEINFVYGNLRERDNLAEIISILKTLNRRHNVVFNIALNTFFTPSKPVKWLPQVSYTYDHVHQFGAFFPVGGEFRDSSQIPDQDSFAQSFNAQWQLSSKFTVGYRYNRAFQDNKQAGRELADFESAVTALTFGVNPHNSLNLTFDLSREGLRNFEQSRIDRTFRLGANATWQIPFIKNLTWSQNFSTTLAGDTGNTNDTRNIEFDSQIAYKFGFGKEKFKKMETQVFVRYANRYGDAFDRVFFVNNFNKTQSFNAGMTFNFF
jgi:hypothetical protein